MKCSWIPGNTSRFLERRRQSAIRSAAGSRRGDRTSAGINLVLNPSQKIVQAWRATGWPEDHYSVAIFDLQKAGAGTRLKFTQIGVPPSRYSGHYRGWIETYWTPMKEIFADGKISDETRSRIQVDKTQRIRHGQFRRKLSS